MGSVALKLYVFRFVNGFINGTHYVITPFFVYKITQSVSMTAISVILETIPTIFSTVLSGPIIKYFSERKSHLGAEGIRILSLILLAYGCIFENVALIIFSGVVISVTNNAVGIINDEIVTKHWGGRNLTHGFSLSGNALSTGRAVAFAIGMLILIPEVLLVIAGVLQLIVLLMIVYYSKLIHVNENIEKSSLLSSINNIKEAFGFIRLRHIKLSLFQMAMWLPSNTFLVFMPFIMEGSSSQITSSALSTYRFELTVGASLATAILTYILAKKYIKKEWILKLSIPVTLSTLLFVIFSDQKYAMYAMIVFGISHAIFLPWAISFKMSQINTDSDLRRTVSSILSCIEMLGPVMAALLMVYIGVDIQVFSALAIILILLTGLVLMVDVKRKRAT